MKEKVRNNVSAALHVIEHPQPSHVLLCILNQSTRYCTPSIYPHLLMFSYVLISRFYKPPVFKLKYRELISDINTEYFIALQYKNNLCNYTTCLVKIISQNCFWQLRFTENKWYICLPINKSRKITPKKHITSQDNLRCHELLTVTLQTEQSCWFYVV